MRIRASVTNRMCNGANSIRSSARTIVGQVISCCVFSLSLSRAADSAMCQEERGCEIDDDNEEEGQDDDDDDEKGEKSVSTTVRCLCMRDNDFPSHMSAALIFHIHLDWHHACSYASSVSGSEAMQNAIDQRTTHTHPYIYIYIYKYAGTERMMMASYVVHHVERISFLSLSVSSSSHG